MFQSFDFYVTPFGLIGVFRRDLLDISPTLTEAAGAIIDVSQNFCY